MLKNSAAIGYMLSTNGTNKIDPKTTVPGRANNERLLVGEGRISLLII
tara:strand:- start:3348 stop:3491 length:144 start_codon:yes stop_codon:yes gene_type:complete